MKSLVLQALIKHILDSFFRPQRKSPRVTLGREVATAWKVIHSMQQLLSPRFTSREDI